MVLGERIKKAENLRRKKKSENKL